MPTPFFLEIFNISSHFLRGSRKEICLIDGGSLTGREKSNPQTAKRITSLRDLNFCRFWHKATEAKVSTGRETVRVVEDGLGVLVIDTAGLACS
ncbi:MAG: hypothetical protein LBS59_01750 [Puniceicoccales bacterium]|jgi:hypothetical protein|nr:hypothetical protein [Puniceicoccales bacterium]